MNKKTTTPSVKKWYLCDDVRTEISNKSTLVGLYSDDIIVLEMPADVPDPSPEDPIVIESVAIMAVVAGLPRRVIARMALTSDAKPLPENFRDLEIETAEGSSSTNVVIKIRPFGIKSLGVKRFIIESESVGLSAEFQFQVIRRDVSPPEVTRELGPARISNKKPTKRKTARSSVQDIQDVQAKLPQER